MCLIPSQLIVASALWHIGLELAIWLGIRLYRLVLVVFPLQLLPLFQVSACGLGVPFGLQ